MTETYPRAFYFGCLDGHGHFLWTPKRESAYSNQQIRQLAPGIPLAWCELIDGDLLRNARIPDAYTGEVHWTCAADNWLAFYWWDNSVDKRLGSNSGFYVHGFPYTELQEAFKYACRIFPKVVTRQEFPLQLITEHLREKSA